MAKLHKGCTPLFLQFVKTKNTYSHSLRKIITHMCLNELILRTLYVMLQPRGYILDRQLYAHPGMIEVPLSSEFFRRLTTYLHGP